MELYERVHYLRDEILHMTQSQFAAELGTNRDVINNIEGNRLKNPAQKKPLLILMCQKYGVSSQWLIDGIGEPEIAVEDEVAAYVEELLGEEKNPLYDLIRAIMKTYNELDPKGQEIIKQFAEDIGKNAKKESGD